MTWTTPWSPAEHVIDWWPWFAWGMLAVLVLVLAAFIISENIGSLIGPLLTVALIGGAGWGMYHNHQVRVDNEEVYGSTITALSARGVHLHSEDIEKLGDLEEGGGYFLTTWVPDDDDGHSCDVRAQRRSEEIDFSSDCLLPEGSVKFESLDGLERFVNNHGYMMSGTRQVELSKDGTACRLDVVHDYRYQEEGVWVVDSDCDLFHLKEDR